MQNFVELPPSPSEKNFVVLNFVLALWRDHTHQLALDKDRKFHGSYYCGGRSIHENRKILHHAKLSCYTVFTTSVMLTAGCYIHVNFHILYGLSKKLMFMSVASAMIDAHRDCLFLPSDTQQPEIQQNVP